MNERRDIRYTQPLKPKPGQLTRVAKDRPPALGSFANPYVREDGVEIVKMTVRISKACAIMYRHNVMWLEHEGLEPSAWLDALIQDGIRRGFMRRSPDGDTLPAGLPDDPRTPITVKRREEG